MNRGQLMQSSPVQQMMTARSPNWWNLSNMKPPPVLHDSSSSFMGSPHPPNLLLIPNSQFIPTSHPPPSWADDDDDDDHQNQQLPESWSQLLLGGLVNEEEKNSGMHHQGKKLGNWEEQLLQQQNSNGSVTTDHHLYSSNSSSHENAEFHGAAAAAAARRPSSSSSAAANWSSQVVMPVSSPTSCVTTLSSCTNNMLDFSSSTNNNKLDGRHPLPDRSSECNSTGSLSGGAGAAKKARVQPSSTQSSFKVRKEKLGDRITALHQIVSPFGKTDTASVLLEAIGYIRFLQSQIEALSLPYLGTSKGGNNMRHQQHQHHVQGGGGGGERNCLFPEDPGQLLNDNCMKRKAMPDQDCEEEPKKDLRSRGLCLVPVSCTLQVGSDNGADYWAPALSGGGFR